MAPKTLSHYRILDRVGEGGMGVVYRAHDEQLERDVAVKVLSPGTLADEGARRRFRKEALSLARLNHPNIATIFEFGSEGDTDFLVTELIPGVTLDSKLAAGALPIKEVISFGLQLTQGLATAHEQGVVHRDLKPGNLRLTPDGRLKILDFGLAQLTPLAGDPGRTMTLTQPHATTAGTLPYMAPEQLRGETPDARSDIWAVGVVLYEMATGKRPFSEITGPVLIDSILNREPPPPDKFNHQISPDLQIIILKALDKDPARRYQSVREMHVDLERLQAGISPLAHSRDETRKGWIAAGLVVLLLAAATAGYFLYRNRTRAAQPGAAVPAGSVKARRSVAVLGFKNLGGQADQGWLSTALSEMLTTELGAGEQLRMVPGEAVSRMRSDLSLPEADSLGGETLGKVRQILGSDLVVLGSFLDLRGNIRVDVRVQDAVGGETLATLSDTGPEDQIFGLVSRLGAQLREKCGAGAISADDEAAAAAAHPANAKAAQLYADGLARLRAFEPVAARDLLARAVAEEPNFAPAHAALSSAWEALGYGVKAKDEIRKAAELADSLPRQDRLEIQARSHGMNGEHDKAVETFQTLFNFFPDNLEYGLGLAKAQIEGGKGKDALETLIALRRLPPPLNGDARIDLTESAAAEQVGDQARAMAAAERARSKAQAVGDRLTQAAALGGEMRMVETQGDHAKARALGDQARQLYEQAGSRDGAATVQFQRGLVLMNQGDREGARKDFEDAFSEFQQVGDEAFSARALQLIGRVKQESGDLSGAGAIYEQVIATYRRIDAKSKLSNVLWHRGGMFKQLGHYTEARSTLTEALDLARSAGPPGLISTSLLELGDLSYLQGDLKQAQTQLQEALASAQQTFKAQVPSIQMEISDILRAQGDGAGSKRLAEQMLKESQDAGQKEDAAYCQYLLAQLALGEGRLKDAEDLARKAAEGLTELGSADEEPDALSVLMESLAGQNRTAEAEQAMAKAEALARQSQDVHIQMQVAISAARVRGAAGKTAEATAALNSVLARAAKIGCVRCGFEARLALGEVEMRSGKKAAGRARLKELAKDAASRGYVAVERRAERAQGS